MARSCFALLSKPDQAEAASQYAIDALTNRPWVGWEDYVATVNALVKRRDVGVLPRVSMMTRKPWDPAPKPDD